MRVAFVAPSAPARSAVGNLLAEKAEFFLDRGAEVRVLLESVTGVHPVLSAYAEACLTPPSSGPAWDFLIHCDLVFVEYSIGFELAGVLPMLVGRRPKVIATYYGLSPSSDWPGPQRELLERGRRERGLLWCADAVVVFSRFLARELTAAIELPAERIHQQMVPIDASRWARTESRLSLRESACRDKPIRLSLANRASEYARPHRAVLLYVGRLAPNKRVPLLIEALAHLPNSEAWIVGDGGDVYAEQVRLAKDLADRLGVTDRVRWIGETSDAELPGLFAQADALVLPSIHEGFGIPVMEANAAGLPVVAARAAALPETVADAGVTFRPDDVDDLVRQLRRVLPVGQAASLPESPPDATFANKSAIHLGTVRPKRVALVSFRFGDGFIGGAETSLRSIGLALKLAGVDVEVFTTCTVRESDWRNDLPAGDSHDGDFVVHRFPIDAYDKDRHDRAFRTIIEKQGDVSDDVEADYLANSVQSSALIAALRTRIAEFDAVIVGPYPHGLAYRAAEAFEEKVLLLPCFHDEPLARLRAWTHVYGEVGGLLYHTPEERDFAEILLGMNHPGAAVIGTCLAVMDADTPHPRPLSRKGRGERAASTCADNGLALSDGDLVQSAPSPLGGEGWGEGDVRTLVYCGRFSIQKNVPQLIEFARRYEAERPGRFAWQFIGEGAVTPPAEPWCVNRGRVSEAEKRAILESADALIQLSTQESLSLVVLESWRHETPVIVDCRCPVLVGQARRSGGGIAIDGYDEFAAALDDLWLNPSRWHDRGKNGRRYVEAEYLNADQFVGRLIKAIEFMTLPLAERMRQRGLERAKRFDRPVWREEFGRFIEQMLDQQARTPRFDVAIEPVAKVVRASVRQTTFLLPCRITNRGELPTIARGPAATQIIVSMDKVGDGESPFAMRKYAPFAERTATLGELIVPGQQKVVLVPIDLPRRVGDFSLTLQFADQKNGVTVPLEIVDGPAPGSAIDGGVGPILEAAQSALAEAYQRQTLPADYLDVTEGRFSRVKRWLKQKLLNNFKRAYVDVISTQQSEVNRRLVESVRQLTECCQALDQAVRQLQERVAESSQSRQPSIVETDEAEARIDRGVIAIHGEVSQVSRCTTAEIAEGTENHGEDSLRPPRSPR
jgi:glycosyltransferase involved in cell wall biosynthesis